MGTFKVCACCEGIVDVDRENTGKEALAYSVSLCSKITEVTADDPSVVGSLQVDLPTVNGVKPSLTYLVVCKECEETVRTQLPVVCCSGCKKDSVVVCHEPISTKELDSISEEVTKRWKCLSCHKQPEGMEIKWKCLKCFAKDCGFCGTPVSKKSKILECSACEKTYHYECAAYSPSKIQELFEKNGWICVNCFICEDDLKEEEKCRKCEKPILEKSKKLQCCICNNKYHHECGVYATRELQELLERTRWICKKCFACDEKEQACNKCKKTVKKESKVLECNTCKNLFHFECAAHAPKKLQEWFEKKGWICGNCLVCEHDSKEKKDEKSKWKSFGKKAAIGAGLTAACLGGIPLAVGALGFGAAGVTAGSLAAAFQSAYLGGTIASGSAFAVLQSVGAAGLAASTQAGIAAVCTTLPFLGNLKKKKS